MVMSNPMYYVLANYAHASMIKFFSDMRNDYNYYEEACMHVVHV